jgi:HSP20 family protein
MFYNSFCSEKMTVSHSNQHGGIIMALVRMRTRPENWNLANSLFQDFDRLFNDVATPTANVSTYPADLYETDEQVVFEMAVPGVKVEDLDISVEGRQLFVRGKLPTTEDTNRRYWVKAIPTGEFTRTVTLPNGVNTDNVEANVQHGILRVALPKVAEAKVKKISINANN